MIELECDGHRFLVHAFVLRTPLLPFSEFSGWGDGLTAVAAEGQDEAVFLAAVERDRALLRQRLRALVCRPEVREAIFVASPDLHEAMCSWLDDPQGAHGARTELALVRYFSRMTGRATPFGLFASCSVGRVGHETTLELAPIAACRRHTRLDVGYLEGLGQALSGSRELRDSVTFRVNSSLYEAAGRLHYIEASQTEHGRSFNLVAVENTPYLAATLKRAHAGATVGEMARPLVDEDVSIDEAESYVRELIDSQVLVSELEPAVTGQEPLDGIIQTLARQPSGGDVVETLVCVRDELSRMDGGGVGVPEQQYHAVAQMLQQLPHSINMSRLFHVDIIRPAPHASLDREPVLELLRGASFLRRLVRAYDPLQSFRERFIARYDRREVPLNEVLDKDIGIGFSDRSAIVSPEADPVLLFNRLQRQEFMAELAVDAARRGLREVVLTDADIKELSAQDDVPTPEAFSIVGTVVAESAESVRRGEFRILFGWLFGPSGANLIGRFCHGDQDLHDVVRDHLRAEQALRPDCVFAEVVHLPEGRAGNVLCRPLLRDFEIPFLGRSGTDGVHQIPISDLHVSVVGDRVVLRSERLDREVIPRLTSAHNVSNEHHLPMYRFLGLLPRQGRHGVLAWSWGGVAKSPFLPRVRVGRVVLSRARWSLNATQLKPLAAGSAAQRFRSVQQLRDEHNLPRYVLLADGDHQIPIDLEASLSADAFVDLARKQEQVTLVEMYPDASDLVVTCESGGRFVHEIVVPFTEVKHIQSGASGARSVHVRRAARSFVPGSEWLYLKIYTGPGAADRLLRTVVSRLVRRAVSSGVVDRWFFIRYADPDFHIRLRLHGDDAALSSTVLPTFREGLQTCLDNALVSRVECGTYEREVERYGGIDGVMAAERLFHADSEAVLQIIERYPGDTRTPVRELLALRGIELLLSDFGLDASEKLQLLEMLPSAAPKFRRGWSERFRRNRAQIENALGPVGSLSSDLRVGAAILEQRSAALGEAVALVRALEAKGVLTCPLRELLFSYTHMYLNRLLGLHDPNGERACYDFLRRFHGSAIARTWHSTNQAAL